MYGIREFCLGKRCVAITTQPHVFDSRQIYFVNPMVKCHWPVHPTSLVEPATGVRGKHAGATPASFASADMTHPRLGGFYLYSLYQVGHSIHCPS